jgi:hypothetical protein
VIHDVKDSRERKFAFPTVEKHEYLRLGHWNLEIGIYLELGAWDLEV